MRDEKPGRALVWFVIIHGLISGMPMIGRSSIEKEYIEGDAVV